MTDDKKLPEWGELPILDPEAVTPPGPNWVDYARREILPRERIWRNTIEKDVCDDEE